MSLGLGADPGCALLQACHRCLSHCAWVPVLCNQKLPNGHPEAEAGRVGRSSVNEKIRANDQNPDAKTFR